MSKWMAIFLIVVSLILDKHIMAWLSLQRAKSAEKAAKYERERAEAYKRAVAQNCESCRMRNLMSLQPITQQVMPWRFW